MMNKKFYVAPFSAKIIFHVAMDYNSTLSDANWAAKTWPATLATNSVNYDIIGLSYYPYYHGPLNYLTTLLTYLQSTYPSKEVQIVEVGYPNDYYPSSCPYDYSGTYAASDSTACDGVIYNLNGQRVTNPGKGLYIKNGKKVFIK